MTDDRTSLGRDSRRGVSNSSWTTALLSSLLLVSAALVDPGHAEAQDSAEAVPGEVLIVLASELPGLIDPRLRDVPGLRRPPFDSYRSMALLSSPAITLRPNVATEVPLPNGRTLRIILEGRSSQGRYRLRVSLNRPDQRDYLPDMQVEAAPGDPFFIAGQSFREGTLVIGVRLGRRAS